jgi:hypothetical protein
MVELNFNPYQTSIVSISPLLTNQTGQTADFDELMKQEIGRRDV